MNKQQKIFNILAKEQKPMKVEFALELGGVKKMASQLKAEIKAYNQKFSTIDDLVRELNNEAGALDKRAENFFAQVNELEREGRAKAKELGLNFMDTPIGKEWDSIARSILSGELETIKQGLKIKL